MRPPDHGPPPEHDPTEPQPDAAAAPAPRPGEAAAAPLQPPPRDADPDDDDTDQDHGDPDDGDEELDDDALVEDPSYLRLSPYAISAFVVAGLALFRIPIGVTQLALAGLPVSTLVSRLASFYLVPIALAALALWLAGYGEDEILLADGRVGGIGFCRSARLAAYVALGVTTVLFGLALLDQPVGQPLG